VITEWKEAQPVYQRFNDAIVADTQDTALLSKLGKKWHQSSERSSMQFELRRCKALPRLPQLEYSSKMRIHNGLDAISRYSDGVMQNLTSIIAFAMKQGARRIRVEQAVKLWKKRLHESELELSGAKMQYEALENTTVTLRTKALVMLNGVVDPKDAELRQIAMRAYGNAVRRLNRQVERTKYTEKRAQVLQECAKRTLKHVEHTKWLQVTATEAIVELVKELQKEILVANEEAANAHTTLDRIRASEKAGLLLRRVERLRMKEWTERMQVKEWDSLVEMHHANANSFTSMVEYVGKQKIALTLPQGDWPSASISRRSIEAKILQQQMDNWARKAELEQMREAMGRKFLKLLIDPSQTAGYAHKTTLPLRQAAARMLALATQTDDPLEKQAIQDRVDRLTEDEKISRIELEATVKEQLQAKLFKNLRS